MNSRLLGSFGEHIASRYLRENGYIIRTTNFRVNSGELDIIAEKDNIISFVEVKTRKEGGLHTPAEAVDRKKQENLRVAAGIYMNKYNLKNEFRFHIAEVLVDSEDKVISVNLIENAF